MSKVQYTIRGVPIQVDRIIRKRAAQTDKSFNQTVVDILTENTVGSDQTIEEDKNFDWLFNATMPDESFDEVIKDFKRIDEELWR